MPNNFGLTRTSVYPAARDRLDEIAREYGANFYSINTPGDSVRGFFEGPNYGFPADRDLRDRVLAAVCRREPKIARALGYIDADAAGGGDDRCPTTGRPGCTMAHPCRECVG